MIDVPFSMSVRLFRLLQNVLENIDLSLSHQKNQVDLVYSSTILLKGLVKGQITLSKLSRNLKVMVGLNEELLIHLKLQKDVQGKSTGC